ncbi:Tyrosinase [Entomophthora muscae]|uniref:Tyrosinase n=1 Tax=Entomophthora muscae TaxID=34485 RepID=A0ACC2SS72_9FUNG|nr:Tyrosinase [Entomophthora muscae]
MKIINLLFASGVSAVCRERKDVHTGPSAYLAAFKKLNADFNQKWQSLLAKMTDENLTKDKILPATRLFLYDVETALQEIDPTVTIPHWISTYDDPVFETTQFGVSSLHTDCIDSITLADFKRKNGTCLKRIHPRTYGVRYSLLEAMKDKDAFSRGQHIVLETMAKSTFQTEDINVAIEDPLFLCVMARMDGSWSTFLENNGYRTKTNPTAELSLNSSDTIMPWNLTLSQVVESNDASCVTYTF